MARLDALDRHVESQFMLSGPMVAAFLPRGTVWSESRRLTPYQGQVWDRIGMLSFVSIDVYLNLVCQVGGTVHLVAGVDRA
ncbi:hypothetical protein AOZ06_04775 [Kibdelosporangium phytohabitans]|uniref:Uncharacterized protein n=1 Tax=Kibdelosporangium phytohabitans TaxID=860235 RepID=A0A0N9HW29_9PSEU|nr:hypothetical protein AOZ06_04775 [Kibdelosporangium phytohabitans]